MNLKKYLSDRGYGAAFFLFCGLLVVMAVVSIGWGRLYISPVHVVKIVLSSVFSIEQTWTDQAASAIFMIRLPRVLSAMMIGAALALSGAAYQSVFKNPLVAPDMLGVLPAPASGRPLPFSWGCLPYLYKSALLSVESLRSFVPCPFRKSSEKTP